MNNIAIHISYDGTDYHGFQRQQNGMTVQQRVEEAVSAVTGENITITGCSRTDAGVHAMDYVCNFKTNSRIPPEKFPFALNTVLPENIRCFKGVQVDSEFHARFSAQSKIYSYKIYNAPHANAVFSRYACHYPLQLDVQKMQTAAKDFIGKKDFSAFMATGGQQKTTVKEIYSLDVEKNGNLIEIKIHANSYLYNMVRIIAGTLMYVGCGKIDASDIKGIIESCDRKKAGITAQPQGLCLEKVFYKEDI